MHIIPQSQVNIAELQQHIRQGKVLVYPTETCYGLGADATNVQAVEHVFHIKKREAGKPVLVLFPSVEILKNFVEWNNDLEKIAQKYWPGAVTVLARSLPDSQFAPGVLNDNNEVAVRISPYPFVSDMVRTLGVPLVSTSANISGGENPYSITEVMQNFDSQKVQPDILIDGGELSHIPPSTLVRVHNGIIEVLRQGSITVQLDDNE